METVIVFDTTLRDGEQSPGASMNTEEKLRVAQALERLRVDVIEAGFPISSPGDFEAVKLIADRVRGVQVTGLARANFVDIDRAWEALKGGANPRIHTFLATSPIHMEHKLRKSPEEVLEQAVEAVKHAGEVHVERGVLRRGRGAQRPGLPVPGPRGGDRRRRHDREHPRHRRATPSPPSGAS